MIVDSNVISVLCSHGIVSTSSWKKGPKRELDSSFVVPAALLLHLVKRQRSCLSVVRRMGKNPGYWQLLSELARSPEALP
jgi:hypothetical protein